MCKKLFQNSGMKTILLKIYRQKTNIMQNHHAKFSHENILLKKKKKKKIVTENSREEFGIVR
jgi:hypothetical protein